MRTVLVVLLAACGGGHGKTADAGASDATACSVPVTPDAEPASAATATAAST